MEIVKKVINGIEYTAVWKGYNHSQKLKKQCLSNGKNKYSNEKLSNVIFGEIIINPKVSADDFDDIEVLRKVFDFGKSVLFGEFEENSKPKLKKDVLSEWDYWRLIFCDLAHFDYDTVFNQMTPQQVLKANIALDIVNDEIKKQKNKK